MSPPSVSSAEFVSKAGHEMRNPLTVVVGVLEALTSGLAGPLPEPARDLLGLAARNATQLQTLIDDYVEICRLETQTLPFALEPVPVGPLLERVAADLQPRALAAGVRSAMRSAAPAQAMAHEQRLRQLLGLLVDNAVKFSAPQAQGEAPEPATVELECVQEAGGVLIRIRDRGIGIPDSFFPQAFGRFARAANAQARGLPGAGLGLAIARELASKMGCRLGYESAENAGTTFTVSLPA